MLAKRQEDRGANLRGHKHPSSEFLRYHSPHLGYKVDLGKLCEHRSSNKPDNMSGVIYRLQ